ncbi:Uncharacterised protein [Mycobacteroides abscessus subsp. abscessus]|nr:Uncharacterised protein [Mycobacteroides abscessus subsp. abscessus]
MNRRRRGGDDATADRTEEVGVVVDADRGLTRPLLGQPHEATGAGNAFGDCAVDAAVHDAERLVMSRIDLQSRGDRAVVVDVGDLQAEQGVETLTRELREIVRVVNSHANKSVTTHAAEHRWPCAAPREPVSPTSRWGCGAYRDVDRGSLQPSGLSRGPTL